MKHKTLSRFDQIDIEAIRAKGNIYETIFMLSARVYRLRKGAPPKIKDYADPYNSGVMTALLEFQSGAYDGLQQSK